MSRYTSLTLQRDEQVIRVARLSWVIYFKALLYAGLACAVAIGAQLTFGISRFAIMIVSALMVMAVRQALRALWRQWTTEIAVTDKRVIYKTGFIRRQTNEMFLTSIESVFVSQTILGRIFNFGSVHCRGNGEGMEHLHYVADPVAVQTAINSK